MPVKRKSSPKEIYQLKVILLGTRPPIWRRLLIPSDATLGRLHDVLQVAMGWTFSHLHEFGVGQERYGDQGPYDDDLSADVIDERKVRLRQVWGRIGARAVYTYDFGDSWDHSIVLEKRLPPDPNLVYPACTGGKGACPPEDCGGLPGFYDFLEAIRNPDHEQHDEMLEWVGGAYDPEAFSIEAVNRALQGRARRRPAF